MLKTVKEWLGLSPSHQRMAGATITILGPLPSVSHCYTIEKAIQKLQLKGWMRFVNQINIEIEVYGTHEAVSTLLDQLEKGTLLQWQPMIDMMWLPYQNKYPSFTTRIFGPSGSRQNSAKTL